MTGTKLTKASEDRNSRLLKDTWAEPALRAKPLEQLKDLMYWQDVAGNRAVSDFLQGVGSVQPRGVTNLPSVVQTLLSKRGGRPLDPDLRTQMELRFGHDFGHVHIHIDEQSAESARAVSAMAYTVGPDIVFGKGKWAPDKPEGKQLLAHELSHVVQQERGGNAPPPLTPGNMLDRAADQAADQAASAIMHDSGPVQIAGASAAGLARQKDPSAPSQAQMDTAVANMTEIRQKYEALRGTVDEIVNDPVVQERLSSIAGGSWNSEKIVEALRGEITEEVMSRDVRARLQTGVGVEQILPEGVSRNEVSFVEGYRLAGVDGKKLSDGLIFQRRGDAWELVTVFESKAGKRSAKELHGTEERVKDPAKIAAKKGGTPTVSEIASWEELQRVKKETGNKGKVIQRELGGQIRSDIERLRQQGRIRVYKVDETGKLLEEFEEVKVKVSNKTLFVGTAPGDVSLTAQIKAFAKEPGIRYRSWNLDAKTTAITKAAKEMREAATKLSTTASVTPTPQVGIEKPSIKPEEPPAYPSKQGIGVEKPSIQPHEPPTPPSKQKIRVEELGPPKEGPRLRVETGEELLETPFEAESEIPHQRTRQLQMRLSEPTPTKLEAKARLPETKLTTSTGAATKPTKAAAAGALESALEKTAVTKGRLATGREVVTNFLKKQAAMKAGQRIESLVPLLGLYVSYLDAKEGVTDLAHGHVVLGLYTIGLAGIDAASDLLHGADIFSGPGGTALSLTIQSWVIAQQVAMQTARAGIRSRELAEYIDKHGELPPDEELDAYGLDPEEILLLKSDIARSKVTEKVSATEVRERLLNRLKDIEQKVSSNKLKSSDVEDLRRERDELLQLLPGVMEAVAWEEAEQKQRTAMEAKQRAEQVEKDRRAWQKRVAELQKEKSKPIPGIGPAGRGRGLIPETPSSPSPAQDPFSIASGGPAHDPIGRAADSVQDARYWGLTLRNKGLQLRNRLSSQERPTEKELNPYFAAVKEWQMGLSRLKKKLELEKRGEAVDQLGRLREELEPQLLELVTHLGG